MVVAEQVVMQEAEVAAVIVALSLEKILVKVQVLKLDKV